jgi:hypothetical protein
MISIGAIYRGPELRESPFCAKLSDASVALRSLRDPSFKGRVPWVNAVFIVAGSLGDADFRGTAYGDYSKKDKGVVVQIAVPAEIAKSADPVPFIIDGLRSANAMAFEFFRQKGEEFPLREAEALVSKIEQRFWTPTIVRG